MTDPIDTMSESKLEIRRSKVVNFTLSEDEFTAVIALAAQKNYSLAQTARVALAIMLRIENAKIPTGGSVRRI